MDNNAIARRNSILMTIEGSLFWAGLAFLQADTVVARFIDWTTGSIALVGLAATMRSLMFLVGQFVNGMYIHRLKSQRNYLVMMGFIGRPVMLIMMALMLTGVTGPVAGWLFIAFYTLFFLLDGLLGLCWMEVCNRTLPSARRGVMMSMQQAFGGLAGVLAGVALRYVLGSDLSLTAQYAIIFGCSGAIMSIDAIVMAFFADKPHEYHPERPVPNLLQYVKGMLPLFTENRSVRVILYGRMLYLLTLISAPLNLLFGASLGGLSAAEQATLVFMPVVGQVLAGALWSQMSRKMGYPAIMLTAQALGVVCALMNLLCYALAMAGQPIMVPLSLTMLLISVNTSGYMGFYQHMVSVVEEEKRALYCVMAAVLTAPMSFGTYLAGLLAEHFGYLPVYGIMLISGGVGLYIAWHFFFSPRSPLPLEHRAASARAKSASM